MRANAKVISMSGLQESRYGEIYPFEKRFLLSGRSLKQRLF